MAELRLCGKGFIGLFVVSDSIFVEDDMSRLSALGFREAKSALESNRISYIITVVSAFVLFDVIVGYALMEDLLEVPALLGTVFSGIATGWVLYDLARVRRSGRQRSS